MMRGMAKRVYSTDEIAEEQGVSVRAVQQWLKQGRLVGERIGSRNRATWVVLAEDYELFKQGREEQTES